MIRLVYLLAGLILGIKGVLFWQEYQIVDTARSASVMMAGIYDGEWEAKRTVNIVTLHVKDLEKQSHELLWNECWVNSQFTPLSFVKETSERCKDRTIIRLDK